MDMPFRRTTSKRRDRGPSTRRAPHSCMRAHSCIRCIGRPALAQACPSVLPSLHWTAPAAMTVPHAVREQKHAAHRSHAAPQRFPFFLVAVQLAQSVRCSQNTGPPQICFFVAPPLPPDHSHQVQAPQARTPYRIALWVSLRASQPTASTPHGRCPPI